MFTRGHVQSGEAEYTTRCGWIDWGHAYAMRSDTVAIWSQLPHRRVASEPPLRLRRILDGRAFRVTNLALVDDALRRVVSPSAITFDYAVLAFDDPDHVTPQQEDFYRGAGLWIYKQGCQRAEQLQQGYGGRIISVSYYAFEDLVSNLLGFYAYVMGWAVGRTEPERDEAAKSRIRSHAGGFQNSSARRDASLAVFEGMGRIDRLVQQLTRRARNWTQCCLFNDLVPRRFGPPNRQRGWTDLPAFFRRIRDFRSPRFYPRAAADGIDLSPGHPRGRLLPTGIPRVRGRDIRPLEMITE